MTFLPQNQIPRLNLLEESSAYKKGYIDATYAPSAEKAAFVTNVNMPPPSEHVQRQNIYWVEEYLHGYYGHWVDVLKGYVQSLGQSETYWRDIAQKLQKLVKDQDEHTNSKARPKRNKQTATKNSRSSGRNTRRNRSNTR